MKKVFLGFLFLGMALFYTSCEVEIEGPELTIEEVVELIEAHFQENVGGVISNITDVTEELILAVASGEICDSTYTETISKDFEGNLIQAAYVSDLSYTMSCNEIDFPESATFIMGTTLNYDMTRVDAESNGTFQGNTFGLEVTESDLVYNADYQSNGVQAFGISDPVDVSTDFIADLENVIVDKGSLDILSGTGTFTFSGASPEDDFSYEGSIVFNGDNTATITIEDTEYVIDWN